MEMSLFSSQSLPDASSTHGQKETSQIAVSPGENGKAATARSCSEESASEVTFVKETALKPAVSPDAVDILPFEISEGQSGDTNGNDQIARDRTSLGYEPQAMGKSEFQDTNDSRSQAVALRIVALFLVAGQAAMLDFVLIRHQEAEGVSWLIVDALVLFLWFMLIFQPLTYRRVVIGLPWPCGINTTRKTKVPPYWFAWGVYAILGVLLKLATAFVVMGDRNESIGSAEGNCLRFSLALSVLIFVILPISYHLKDISESPGAHIRRQHFFHSLFHLVVEIIDCAEFMEFFVDQRMNEHHSVEAVGINCTLDGDLGIFNSTLHTVQGFALVTVLLVFVVVTVELHNLLGAKWRYTGSGRVKRSRRHSWVMVGLIIVNLSFLILRIVLWNQRRLPVSMLMVKNVLVILWMVFEAYWVIINS